MCVNTNSYIFAANFKCYKDVTCTKLIVKFHYIPEHGLHSSITSQLVVCQQVEFCSTMNVFFLIPLFIPVQCDSTMRTKTVKLKALSYLCSNYINLTLLKALFLISYASLSKTLSCFDLNLYTRTVTYFTNYSKCLFDNISTFY